MADYTLRSTDRGIYEIPVAADQTVTVELDSNTIWSRVVRVVVHSSTAPVYVKTGTAATPKDPTADMIPGLSFLDIAVRGGKTIAITSAQPSIVSVVRS